MRLPDKIAPFLELLHIYRETGWENSESISDWSKQCFVFVACEEQDKEKLEEYITELHKKIQTEQRLKKVDISLAMEEATEKNTFMRTDFLSDASN